MAHARASRGVYINRAIAIQPCYKLEKARPATKWPSTSARITKSALRAKHQDLISECGGAVPILNRIVGDTSTTFFAELRLRAKQQI